MTTHLSFNTTKQARGKKSYVCLFRHLDFFEMVRNEDDSELAKRFDMVSNKDIHEDG